MEYQLSIPGMKCSGCVSTVEAALNTVSDVTGVDVNLDDKSAQVEFNGDVAILINAVKARGFECVDTNS